MNSRSPLIHVCLCVALLLPSAQALADPVPARSAHAPRPERFVAVHVFLDPGERSLASFQLELGDESGTATIVGIEGGDHPAFREPPFYDPAALGAGRIVIAAFSTAAELPRHKTRVASLHLLVSGADVPDLVSRLEIATDPLGREIPVIIELEGVRS
jgi:hypothetical protein